VKKKEIFVAEYLPKNLNFRMLNNYQKVVESLKKID